MRGWYTHWQNKRSSASSLSFFGHKTVNFKCLFSNTSLLRSTSVVMCFEWRLQECCFLDKQEWCYFYKDFAVWHFSTSCENRKTLNIEPFLLQINASRLWWFGHVTRRGKRKIGQKRSAGCTNGKADHMSTKDQAAWLHLRLCLVQFWCRASIIIWACCWPWGISRSTKAALATLVRGKMNE